MLLVTYIILVHLGSIISLLFLPACLLISLTLSINSCSIGNFFFAGARVFFQSLDAAIFLFSRVSQIPAESLVLPVISTNDRLTLGCELWVILSQLQSIVHTLQVVTCPI